MIDGDPRITRITSFTCPHCGKVTDAVGTTDASAGAPTAGDACGCIACGEPMTFVLDPLTGALRLRRMTAAEADLLTDEQKTELARVQFFARAVYQPGRN